MSDDESYKDSSDADYAYATIISQAHVYEQEERDKESEDPASSPSPFRPSAIISRGLTENLFGPSGDLNSQIGSLAWVEANGYHLAQGDSEREGSAAPEEQSDRNPGSPFRVMKAEDTELELLRFRCSELDTERRRLADELAQLRIAFDNAQAQANEWELIARTASGCIRKAMLQLTDAGQILGE